MSLSDLERVVGVKIDQVLDANAVSGLMMQRLARMPETGEAIDEAGIACR